MIKIIYSLNYGILKFTDNIVLKPRQRMKKQLEVVIQSL
jgi:hypothetical protein